MGSKRSHTQNRVVQVWALLIVGAGPMETMWVSLTRPRIQHRISHVSCTEGSSSFRRRQVRLGVVNSSLSPFSMPSELKSVHYVEQLNTNGPHTRIAH